MKAVNPPVILQPERTSDSSQPADESCQLFTVLTFQLTFITISAQQNTVHYISCV